MFWGSTSDGAFGCLDCDAGSLELQESKRLLKDVLENGR
jgi:hypothetical protein